MKSSLRAKAFSIILLFALILSFCAVFVSSQVHKDMAERQSRDLSTSLATTAAFAMADHAPQVEAMGNRVREIFDAYCLEHGSVPDLEHMTEKEQQAYRALFKEVTEMDGYGEVLQDLLDLASVNDALYMYLVIWDEDSGNMIYIMDGSVDDDPTPAGWLESIEEENLARIRTGVVNIPPYIGHYDEYGWLCTANANVFNASGKIIAHAYVDVSMDNVMYTNEKYTRNIALMLAVITLILMPFYLYTVNQVIVHPIKKIARAAQLFVIAREKNKNIFAGLGIRSNDEIGRLSSSMQTMETQIEHYITDLRQITSEKERVSAELNVATQIQADMLPGVFPPFPERKEFDIFATMDPAKEVGGDFYDFFLIDENHLALVMADVSGKGVPAALFMVIAKTLIKNRAIAGSSPADVLAYVNEQLCEGNKSQLFVTVWLAILDLRTGKGVAANAGHEDPVVRHPGGDFELIKYRHSPAVATIEGIRFREHDFELHPGDTLFVYTDGVPEATNTSSKLYGTDRMLNALNRCKDQPLEDLLHTLKSDIDEFVGVAPQFDDITMLALNYYGSAPDRITRELRLTATPESLNDVNAFVEGMLEEYEASPKASMQIMVALEELYVNIANYAYAPGQGEALVRVTFDRTDRMFSIELTDSGMPFDPVAKADPDITLKAEDRPVGGLGIYMVKKSMDVFTYEYRDNRNTTLFGKKI